MGGCVGVVDQRTVAEFLEDPLLNIRSSEVVFAAPVNGFVMVFQSFLGVKNRFKFLPFNFKQRKGLNGRRFVNSSNTSNQIADVADFFHGHGVFVFGDGKNAESVGCILAGGHGHDARERFDLGGVNGFDASVVVRGAENFPDQLPGEPNVIAVPGLPGHLRIGINQRHGFADGGSRPRTVVNVVASGFGLFASHGFRNKIQVSGTHGRVGTSRAGGRKGLLPCNSFSVLSHLRGRGARLLLVGAHGDHFAWPGGMVGSSGPDG